ncbi:MAG: L-2-amino-thiazoline-4-carboxylic acid hydrolase [Candidatus Heimdallarchaeota archaeon]
MLNTKIDGMRIEMMEVIKLGKLNPNALEQIREIQPKECALNAANNIVNNFACLKRLDYLLGFIDKNYQEILTDYVENLNKKFQKLLSDGFLRVSDSDLLSTIKETLHLKKYPELVESTLNFYLQLLKLSSNINWLTENVKVKEEDYILSYMVPSYYYLQVLTEVIGREEAFNLFKRYISQFLDAQKANTKIEFTTLEDRFEQLKKSLPNNMEWVIVCGLLSKGKYIYRNDNCLWIDALKEFPDKEIKYYICCYGDYQIANTYSNGHTILTMKHTIAQGDQYCSRVRHDIRIDWNLEHPEKDIFDNMRTLTEMKK